MDAVAAANENGNSAKAVGSLKGERTVKIDSVVLALSPQTSREETNTRNELGGSPRKHRRSASEGFVMDGNRIGARQSSLQHKPGHRRTRSYGIQVNFSIGFFGSLESIKGYETGTRADCTSPNSFTPTHVPPLTFAVPFIP